MQFADVLYHNSRERDVLEDKYRAAVSAAVHGMGKTLKYGDDRNTWYWGRADGSYDALAKSMFDSSGLAPDIKLNGKWGASDALLRSYQPIVDKFVVNGELAKVGFENMLAKRNAEAEAEGAFWKSVFMPLVLGVVGAVLPGAAAGLAAEVSSLGVGTATAADVGAAAASGVSGVEAGLTGVSLPSLSFGGLSAIGLGGLGSVSSGFSSFNSSKGAAKVLDDANSARLDKIKSDSELAYSARASTAKDIASITDEVRRNSITGFSGGGNSEKLSIKLPQLDVSGILSNAREAYSEGGV